VPDMFKLHDGKPLPKIERSQPARKWPVRDQRVGQYFLLPGRDVKPVSAYVSRITKDITGKFSARRAWMVKDGDDWKLCEETTPDAVEGVGVWRTE
jgi:hypothetical protein